MKGVVYLGDSAVEVREFPRPKPGPGEALIEMKVAGLCGSDLHKYHKDKKWADERNGMISGHEPAGIVAEIGHGVTNVAVGDRVAVYHSIGCGHCAHCLSGEPVFCRHEGALGRTRDGCHADFMLTEARFCLPLPDDLSFTAGAALACTAGTAFAAARKASAAPHDLLVVFGLGPVGLTALLLGRAMGFRGVGVEVNPYRLDHAKRLGVTDLIDAANQDPVSEVHALTDGEGASAVIECSGNDRARRQAVDLAAIRAVVVFVGAGSDVFCFDPTTVLHRELTIRGNAVYSMAAYFDAVQFLQKHEVPLDDMVTHRYHIDEAPQAFAEFNKGNTGKVVFEWR